jgi:hypothetical protein
MFRFKEDATEEQKEASRSALQELRAWCRRSAR